MSAEAMAPVVEIARHFNAPPQEVWEAWTDPDQLDRWWWPERFHTEYVLDVREGGSYRFRTVDVPGVGVLDVSGHYLLVDSPRALEYTWRWEGQADPDTRVKVEFVGAGGDTEVRLQHGVFADTRERDNHVIGWNDCLDRLSSLLDSSR